MTRPTVFIVDDDAGVRDSLAMLLELKGFHTRTFAAADAFLAEYRPEWPGCLVLDLRMPGMSGLELQQELARRGSLLPVVVLTGHGDVNSARRALRAHAIDFLTKPFKEADLLSAIEQGFAIERERLAQTRAVAAGQALVATLTAREREVAALLATGAQNLVIARQLSISPRTVEIHKARCMEKLGARTLADLVRIADRTGLHARGEPET
jgi:FixJ family two-component response regulator